MDQWISATTLKMQKRKAKDCTMSIQQLPDAETHKFFHSNKSDKGPTSSSKATKNIRMDLIHLHGKILFSPQCIRLHLRHHDGNRATGGQRGTGTRGTLHHGVNCFLKKKSFQMKDISLARNLISWQSTGERRGVISTPTAHTFFSCAFCQRACPSLLSPLSFRLQSSRHALTSRTCVAQAQHEALRIVSCPKIVTSHRAMSYVTPHVSITPGTCTPSLTRTTSLSSDPLLGQLQTCADLRQLELGSLAEPPSFTVCGPHGGTWRSCAALWYRSRTCGLDIELHETLSKARLSLCAQIWLGSNNRTAVQGLRLEQIHGIV